MDEIKPLQGVSLPMYDALVMEAMGTPISSECESSTVETITQMIRERLRSGHGVIVTPVEGVETMLDSKCWFPNGTTITGRFIEGVHVIEDATVETMDRRISGTVHSAQFQGSVEAKLPGIGRYSGEVNDGLPHGSGLWMREDGSWFEGTWQRGEREGFGAEHFDEHTMYEGNWQNDKFHGVGHIRAPGLDYQGEWRENKRHGTGILKESRTVDVELEVKYDNGEIVSVEEKKDLEIARLKDIVETLKRESEEVQVRLRQEQARPATARERNRTADASSGGNVKCKICMSNTIDRVLRPCGHAAICGVCEQRLRRPPAPSPYRSRFMDPEELPEPRRCPICRERYDAADIIVITT